MKLARPAALAAFLFALHLIVTPAHAQDLWDLAHQKAQIHRISTLIPAGEVRSHLADPAKLQAAIDWCKKTGVTKVYMETFRDGYQADRAVIQKAKDRFQAAGIIVSGCVTTTNVGKKSTGWSPISCYTDIPTQNRLQAIFEYTAGLFDEIMIDDFWFTDCACPACEAARKAKTVTIGTQTYPVAGDTFADYRCELLTRLSQDRILAPAKRVNPKVQVIIKYPQWYDRFHERGYEVLRETAGFDRTWVGTEIRDYTDPRWGGTCQYEAYFIMRWLGGIGGEKCDGGWFDPYGTTERTYIEQARQTVLAGAKESVLFCYGSLLTGTGPKNVEAFRANLAELLQVSEQVRKRQVIGIAAYKPANSAPEKEQFVFDFVGMLGLPLVPTHQFPADAPAAFFSIHALKDPQLVSKLEAFIATGKPVLITDGLAAKLSGKINLKAPNVRILEVKGAPKSLLNINQKEADLLRSPLLQPLKTQFESPARVGLYLFSDGSYVVENFNDNPVNIRLNSEERQVPARGWLYTWK